MCSSDLDVSLEITNHQQIERRMIENEDDLYIISQIPETVDLRARPFLDNPLVVVAPKNHPLAGRKHISITALNDEPFIMREPGSGTRQAVQNLFEEQDISVRVRLQLGSNEAIKHSVAGGMGISVLSQHTLISEGTDSELTVLDVEHFPIQRRWYVTYLAGKKLSIIAQTFLEHLLEESKNLHFPASSQLISLGERQELVRN